ncbi:hypothetical protein ACVMBY_000340 [Bradyrhizobium huanghuaihaiense]
MDLAFYRSGVPVAPSGGSMFLKSSLRNEERRQALPIEAL